MMSEKNLFSLSIRLNQISELHSFELVLYELLFRAHIHAPGCSKVVLFRKLEMTYDLDQKKKS